MDLSPQSIVKIHRNEYKVFSILQNKVYRKHVAYYHTLLKAVKNEISTAKGRINRAKRETTKKGWYECLKVEYIHVT